jgi:hypothetical protein
MFKLDLNQEGIVMTGEVKGENAVAQFRSSVKARADSVGSLREDQARPVGSSKWHGIATTATNPAIVAVEQWLSLLLGLVCIACGGWGICMKYSQNLSSGYVQWLGSAYGPALRLTALACLAFGAVLARWGLARLDLSSVSGSREVLPSAGRNRARDAEVPPARRTSLDFAWKGKGRNW